MSYGHFIAGRWQNSTKVRPNINPSDLSDVIGEYGDAEANDADAAIVAARDAFPGWAYGSPQVRADVLDRAGTLITERKADLGKLLAREEGKTIAEAIGEVRELHRSSSFRRRSDSCWRRHHSIRASGLGSSSSAAAARRRRSHHAVEFSHRDSRLEARARIGLRQTAVLKPAELTPGCAWALFEILEKAGLPAGVANLVIGSGRVVGPRLIESPHVSAISITGSVNTGRSVIARCAQLGKRVQAEMGGKNPMIVLDDADLNVAVNELNGAFFSTGQRCTASSRLIVTEGIHDRFVAALTEKMKALRVGNALESPDRNGSRSSMKSSWSRTSPI